jgi:hypothetical protein
MANMRFSALFAIAVLAHNPCLAAADDCLRNQGPVLKIVPGQDRSGDVKFAFESRRERYDKANRKYVWCIEADRDNPNIAEFKWGLNTDPCKYLCGLIEPGRGSPAVKYDGSDPAELDRSIVYTRKNRDEWRMHPTKTVSSRTIGSAAELALVLPIQFPAPGANPSPRPFVNDEGLIQIDRLSSNRDALLAFLRQEKEVSAGGELTVTLPRSSAIANALKTSTYEKYDPADFVRAKTSLQSTLSYIGGLPMLAYSLTLFSDDKDSFRLETVLSQASVEIGISPKTDSWVFPFPARKLFSFSRPGYIELSKTVLEGSIVHAPATLQVLVGGVDVGGFDVSLFAARP